MISGAPVVMGDKLFVQSESGELAAIQVPVSERVTPEAAEDNAEAGQSAEEGR
jgi:hypothetical protein